MSAAPLQRSAGALRGRRDADLAAVAMRTKAVAVSGAKSYVAAADSLGKVQSQPTGNAERSSNLNVVSMSASLLRSAIASGVVSADDAFAAIAQRCSTVGLALGAVSESVLDIALHAAASFEQQRTHAATDTISNGGIAGTALRPAASGQPGPQQPHLQRLPILWPLSVKEEYQQRGCVPTLGLLRKAGNAPERRDGVLVHLLRAAGAVPIVSSTLPQLVMSTETSNAVTGLACNPWDPGRITGGSSGGEGALLASCCSSIGVGSDIAGSVRLPALACGVTGFKPTAARMTCMGLAAVVESLEHLPHGVSAVSPYMDASADPECACEGQNLVRGTPGPMARSAADLALVMRAWWPPRVNGLEAAPRRVEQRQAVDASHPHWQPEPVMGDADAGARGAADSEPPSRSPARLGIWDFDPMAPPVPFDEKAYAGRRKRQAFHARCTEVFEASGASASGAAAAAAVQAAAEAPSVSSCCGGAGGSLSSGDSAEGNEIGLRRRGGHAGAAAAAAADAADLPASAGATPVALPTSAQPVPLPAEPLPPEGNNTDAALSAAVPSLFRLPLLRSAPLAPSQRLRVGYFTDDGGFFTPAAPCVRAVQQAAAAMAAAGHDVVPWHPASHGVDLRALSLSYGVLVGADAMEEMRVALQGEPQAPLYSAFARSGAVPSLLRDPLAAAVDWLASPRMGDILRATKRRTMRDAWEWNRRRNCCALALRQGMARDGIDVLLAIGMGVPAWKHGQVGDLEWATTYAWVWNALDAPAGIVPVTRVRDDECCYPGPTPAVADPTHWHHAAAAAATLAADSRASAPAAAAAAVSTPRQPGTDVRSAGPNLEALPAYERDRIALAAAECMRGAAGLPVGVHVVGAPFGDETVLLAMVELERALQALHGFPDHVADAREQAEASGLATAATAYEDATQGGAGGPRGSPGAGSPERPLAATMRHALADESGTVSAADAAAGDYLPRMALPVPPGLLGAQPPWDDWGGWNPLHGTPEEIVQATVRQREAAGWGLPAVMQRLRTAAAASAEDSEAGADAPAAGVTSSSAQARAASSDASGASDDPDERVGQLLQDVPRAAALLAASDPGPLGYDQGLALSGEPSSIRSTAEILGDAALWRLRRMLGL